MNSYNGLLSKLSFSFLEVFIFLSEQTVLLFELLVVVLHRPVVDLEVAHGQERRQQELHYLRPVLQYGEAVCPGLQSGEAGGGRVY